MKFDPYVISAVIAIALIFGILLILPINPLAESTHPSALSADSVASAQSSADEVASIQESSVKSAANKVDSELYSISISTNNETYHATDPVLLTINVTVPENMTGEHLRFFGFKNKFGAYKTQRWIDIGLGRGENSIETKTNVPPCYTCSGIDPGKYRIYAALYDDDKNQIINNSVEVEIFE